MGIHSRLEVMKRRKKATPTANYRILSFEEQQKMLAKIKALKEARKIKREQEEQKPLLLKQEEKKHPVKTAVKKTSTRIAAWVKPSKKAAKEGEGAKKENRLIKAKQAPVPVKKRKWGASTTTREEIKRKTVKPKPSQPIKTKRKLRAVKAKEIKPRLSANNAGAARVPGRKFFEWLLGRKKKQVQQKTETSKKAADKKIQKREKVQKKVIQKWRGVKERNILVQQKIIERKIKTREEQVIKELEKQGVDSEPFMKVKRYAIEAGLKREQLNKTLDYAYNLTKKGINPEGFMWVTTSAIKKGFTTQQIKQLQQGIYKIIVEFKKQRSDSEGFIQATRYIIEKELEAEQLNQTLEYSYKLIQQKINPITFMWATSIAIENGLKGRVLDKTLEYAYKLTQEEIDPKNYIEMIINAKRQEYTIQEIQQLQEEAYKKAVELKKQELNPRKFIWTIDKAIKQGLKNKKTIKAIEKVADLRVNGIIKEIKKEHLLFLGRTNLTEKEAEQVIAQLNKIRKEGKWKEQTYLNYLAEQIEDAETAREFAKGNTGLIQKKITRQVEEKQPEIKELKTTLTPEQYEEFTQIYYFSKEVLKGGNYAERDLKQFLNYIKELEGKTVLRKAVEEEKDARLKQLMQKIINENHSFEVEYKGQTVEYRIEDEAKLQPIKSQEEAAKQVVTQLKEEIKNNKGYWKKLYNTIKERYPQAAKAEKLENIVTEKNATQIAEILLNEIQSYPLKNKAQLTLKLLEIIRFNETKSIREKIQNTIGNERIEWIKTYWEDAIKEPINNGQIKLSSKAKKQINTQIREKMDQIKAKEEGTNTSGILTIELSEGEATDILKGTISSDCTTAFNTAFNHLKDPYLLNFKIKEGTDWIGNIYGVVTKNEEGKLVLLIDAVQFNTTHEITSLKRKELDKAIDNILDGLTEWASDKFDEVALGNFGSERGRLKQYLQQKYNEAPKEKVTKPGQRTYIESIKTGEAKAATIWKKQEQKAQMTIRRINEAEQKQELIQKFMQYSMNSLIQEALSEIVGREVEQEERELKIGLIKTLEEKQRQKAMKDMMRGMEGGAPPGRPPKPREIPLPSFVAERINKAKTPQQAEKAVKEAIEYILTSKAKTEEKVTKEYAEAIEKALTSNIKLTENGAEIDVEKAAEQLLNISDEMREKMDKYNKEMEEKNKKEEPEVIVINPPIEEEEVPEIEISDELRNGLRDTLDDIFGRKEEMQLPPIPFDPTTILPKEIQQAFKKYPELKNNPEIEKLTNRLLSELFFKNPLQKLEETLLNTKNLTLEQMLLEQEIRKKPISELEKLQEAIKEVEEE